ncbi:hypothetical protein BDF19DRAFT_441286 [Syncephalis fuscata]|nr:hypothetical protein BDF19DRAFT_441286 [Syncephalis fuscata]
MTITYNLNSTYNSDVDYVARIAAAESSNITYVPIKEFIFLILFFDFGCLHFWRYCQTSTKYHAVIAGAALSAAISFSMCIAGVYTFDNTAILHSAPFLMLYGWIIKVIVTYLVTVWSRSMRKAIIQRARLVRGFGIAGIAAYSTGNALVIGSCLIHTDFIKLSSIDAVLTLLHIGYGITLTCSLLLIGLFVWQFVEIKRSGVPGLGFKRRQLLVLMAHCILIFISDLCYILIYTTAGCAFSILVLGVGVYTRKALAGFDQEPDLTNCMPVVMPNAVQVQQKVNIITNPSMLFL